MIDYVFRGPTYRPFPYERLLAIQELAAVTGREATRRGDALTLSVRQPLPTECLQRLAFTSWIEAPDGAFPTHAHLLERSILHLRNGSPPWLGRGASSRKESTYLTHGLHRYKGKFYPQLCRSLINIAGVKPENLVLDPFMGSGTTLVECAASRIDSIGFDMNPLAHLITSAKLELLRTSPEYLQAGIERFEAALSVECQKAGLNWAGFDSSEPEGDPDFPAEALAKDCGIPEAAGEIQRWFPAAVCHKLAVILRAIRRVRGRALRGMIQVSLSDQVRSISQQDPRDLRIRRRAEEIEDAPVLSSLAAKLRREFCKLKAGMEVLGGPVTVKTASAELRDARTVSRRDHAILSGRQADAIVTSPPYASALPYIDTDRLSLLILGLLSTNERNRLQKQIIGTREIHDGERRMLEKQMEGPEGVRTFPARVSGQIRQILEENKRTTVGFRRRNVPALLFQYFRDMRAVMSHLRPVIRPRGKAFFVLGDSTTTLGSGEELRITTTEHLAALAEQVGWTVLDSIPITVTIEDLAHVGNAITENRILILERTACFRAHGVTG